ncbi:hypothetical protein [Spongiactinospora sp. 9N601]|uniref:hypothetical protein n=1 Tax=Spongiactinospora sp. 9N601 TaxID=3375149 RepID=UPI0037B9A416
MELLHGATEVSISEADLRDLALVLARSVTDTGGRVSLDAVLTAFGLARESPATPPGGRSVGRPPLETRSASLGERFVAGGAEGA